MRLLTLAAVLAMAATPAIAQNTMPSATPPIGTTGAATDAAAEAGLIDDRTFVREAASGGFFEVQSSQLALANSEDDAIRRFAEMMIEEHTRANQELMTAAASADIQPPAQMGAVHQAMLQDLQAQPRDRFDHKYAEQQVIAHYMAINLYQREAQLGEDEALQDFAKELVPTLQKHYQTAQGLLPQLTAAR